MRTTEIITRFMYYDPNDTNNSPALESDYTNWKKLRQCEIKTHIQNWNPAPSPTLPGGGGAYIEQPDYSEYKSVLVNLNPAYFYAVMIQIESEGHDGIEVVRDDNHASTLTIIEVGGDTTGNSGKSGIIPIEPVSLPRAMEFDFNGTPLTPWYSGFNSTDAVALASGTNVPSGTTSSSPVNTQMRVQFQHFHADSTGYHKDLRFFQALRNPIIPTGTVGTKVKGILYFAIYSSLTSTEIQASPPITGIQSDITHAFPHNFWAKATKILILHLPPPLQKQHGIIYMHN